MTSERYCCSMERVLKENFLGARSAGVETNVREEGEFAMKNPTNVHHLTAWEGGVTCVRACGVHAQDETRNEKCRSQDNLPALRLHLEWAQKEKPKYCSVTRYTIYERLLRKAHADGEAKLREISKITNLTCA